MTDLLTTLSQITTISADLLIILPFVSRNIRRKLFRAIIVDILYDITTGNNGQTAQMIDTMKKIVEYYEKIVKEKDD